MAWERQYTDEMGGKIAAYFTSYLRLNVNPMLHCTFQSTGTGTGTLTVLDLWGANLGERPAAGDLKMLKLWFDSFT